VVGVEAGSEGDEVALRSSSRGVDERLDGTGVK
jgi:hypothetical protein